MADTERERARELFDHAAELPAAERASYLDAHCDDEQLRAYVERLLEHDARGMEGFLEKPAVPPPEIDAESDPAHELAGLPATIGRFRVLRKIGAGGMGEVYEAEQDQPRRLVALKTIRPGFASEEIRRRFRTEVEVLGQLQHPGIAQVYEAGVVDTPAGPFHFFAMERVDGMPLTEYAEERRLEIEERLDLLARLCDAVDYAHQRGVVHRDLKPENILVDASGQPKVLDFGVARVTDVDIQATTLHTSAGQLIGTLAYMSPEQAAGDPREIDARSDVYALGVIAYELLSGELPIDVAGKSITEAVRRIVDEDPRRLSSVRPVLSGDVETIVSKALEKAKTQRFASAAEVGADIRRYLRGEPILARPLSAWGKLARKCRRHWGKAATIAAVLTLGVVAGLFALKSERDSRALLERDYGPRVTAAVKTMQLGRLSTGQVGGLGLERLLPEMGAMPGRAPGELGSVDYQSLLENAGLSPVGDALKELDAAAATVPGRVDAYWYRARARRILGDDERARADLELALKIDPAFFPAMVALADIFEESDRGTAETWRKRAKVLATEEWSRAWIAANDASRLAAWPEAAREFRRALELAGERELYVGWDLEARLERARALTRQRNSVEAYAESRVVQSQWPDSREANLLAGIARLLMDDAEGAEREFEGLHARSRFKDDIALAVATTYQLNWLDPDLDRALAWIDRVGVESIRERMRSQALFRAGHYREGRVAGLRAIELDPGDADAYRELAGNILFAGGSAEEPYRLLRQAPANESKLEARALLALVCSRLKKVEEALEECEYVLAQENARGEHLSFLASAFANLEIPERALELHRRAVEVSPRDFVLHNDLAVFLREQGRYEEAVDACNAAIALDCDARPHAEKGLALELLGRLDEAVAEFREAARKDPQRSYDFNQLGRLLLEQGKHREAFAAYTSSLRVDPEDADAHAALRRLISEDGNTEIALGDEPEQLVPVLENALEGARSRVASTLAMLHRRLGNDDDVRRALDRVLSLASDPANEADEPWEVAVMLLEPDHPEIVTSLEKLNGVAGSYWVDQLRAIAKELLARRRLAFGIDDPLALIYADQIHSAGTRRRWHQGRNEIWEDLFSEVVAIRHHHLPKPCRKIADARWWRVNNLIDLGRYSEAAESAREVFEIWRQLDSVDTRAASGMRWMLGKALLEQGDLEQAEGHLLASYSRLLEDRESFQTRNASRNLVKLYVTWRKPAKAILHLAKALRWDPGYDFSHRELREILRREMTPDILEGLEVLAESLEEVLTRKNVATQTRCAVAGALAMVYRNLENETRLRPTIDLVLALARDPENDSEVNPEVATELIRRRFPDLAASLDRLVSIAADAIGSMAPLNPLRKAVEVVQDERRAAFRIDDPLAPVYADVIFFAGRIRSETERERNEIWAKIFREVVEIRDRHLPGPNKKIANAVAYLVNCVNDPDEVVPLARRAIELRGQTHSDFNVPSRVSTPNLRCFLGRALSAQGEEHYPEAERELLRSYSESGRHSGWTEWNTRFAVLLAVDLYSKWGKRREALQFLAQVLSRDPEYDELHTRLRLLLRQKDSGDFTEERKAIATCLEEALNRGATNFQMVLQSLAETAPGREIGAARRLIPGVRGRLESGDIHSKSLVELADLQYAAAERAEAIRTVERATVLPSVAPRLEKWRAEQLPDLVSYASIDAALESPKELERGYGTSERVRSFLAFSEGKADVDIANRRAYLEGRFLQKEERHAEAAERFAALARRDPKAVEPALRLAESLVASGDAERAVAALRESLDVRESERLRRAWVAISLAQPGRSPAELLARLAPASTASSYVNDLRWLLEQLESGDAVRINSGGIDYKDARGNTWSRDRFYVAGACLGTWGNDFDDPRTKYDGEIVGTGDAALYQTERWFPGTRGYEVPLVPGSYRLTLHFAEIFRKPPERRIFDVFVEGEKILESYEPIQAGFATAEIKSVELSVEDGILDIEFAHHSDAPKISAIEIEPAQ